MSVTVGVEPDTLVLEPGSRATVTVRVANSGDVVEHYETTVLGLPFGVSAVSQPPTTKLRPGEQGVITLTVELSLKPPPPATSTVLGVLVTSPYRQEVSRCEELRLQVMPISGLTARAAPEMATGARANYRLEVTNPGNTPLLVALAGEDAEQAADVQFDPYELYVAPGSTAAAMVTVAARRPWTGVQVRRNVDLKARTPDVEASATVILLQRPRIPSTVLRIVGVVGGLALMAGAMFGAARMATKMLNDGASTREGDRARVESTASIRAAEESAKAAIEAARQSRLAEQASAAASVSQALLSASGAERSALLSSSAALASQSASEAAAYSASLAAVEASAASASAAAASSASASSMSAAASSSLAAASSSSLAAASSSAASESARLAAVPLSNVDLAVPPPGMPATHVGPVAAAAYPPLTITALPGTVSGACATTNTVNRLNTPTSGYFVAAGTVDAAGHGQCLEVPLRIQFATPVRQVLVTVVSTAMSGATVSTLPAGYSLQVEGGGEVTNIGAAGTQVQLGTTAAAGGPLISAVRISGLRTGTDTPLVLLKAVGYK